MVWARMTMAIVDMTPAPPLDTILRSCRRERREGCRRLSSLLMNSQEIARSGRGCATPLRGFEDLLSDVKESSNYMAQASCSRGVVQYKVGGVFFYSIASVKLLAWKYKFKLVSLQIALMLADLDLISIILSAARKAKTNICTQQRPASWKLNTTLTHTHEKSLNNHRKRCRTGHWHINEVYNR
ncbi:hypothetical protein ZWY2020_037896 [Hordeum vulgare]|nr:hypothetical protein ZWY2020_025274 [Hordeum vulgare]KAI4995808.1 hypothetical protein ZWY2020_037896 [Hordeum vulgare]